MYVNNNNDHRYYYILLIKFIAHSINTMLLSQANSVSKEHLIIYLD